jgi:hypothetical protein
MPWLHRRVFCFEVPAIPFLRGPFAWRFRHANAACILRAFVGGLGGAGGLRALAVADGGAVFFCFGQVGAEWRCEREKAGVKLSPLIKQRAEGE